MIIIKSGSILIPSIKIYVDMDGVLVDFDLKLKEIFGYLPTKLDKEQWEIISNSGPKWWVSLKWMPDGKELWNYLKAYKPILLTSPSKHKHSRLGKKIWIFNNIGSTPFIIDSDKAKYAQPGDILIDDRKENISKWEEAGGIGVLHSNTRDTIEKFGSIINKRLLA